MATDRTDANRGRHRRRSLAAVVIALALLFMVPFVGLSALAPTAPHTSVVVPPTCAQAVADIPADRIIGIPGRGSGVLLAAAGDRAVVVAIGPAPSPRPLAAYLFDRSTARLLWQTPLQSDAVVAAINRGIVFLWDGDNPRGGAPAAPAEPAARRGNALEHPLLRHMRFEELGLSAATARAFINLDPDTPLPTQELARRLSCDPSNVTAFVDRLEEAGLVERRVDRRDRRIKTLAVTDQGRRLRDRMTTLMATDVPTIEALSPDEQRALLALLDKARAAADAYDAGARDR